MDWIIVAITVILLVAYIFLRRKNQVSAQTAIAYVKQGAVVIDLRSPAEYASGHVKAAINIPLPQIDSLIAIQVPDKDQVLLLHCQSGARSAAATGRLNALGYRHAHNLGSYTRAAHIIDRS